MSWLPACLIEAGPAPTRTAFVLHGILGSARNWRTFARELVRRHPDWRLVLVDLRNHGDSRGAPPPHTIDACAADLAALAASLDLVPEAVVGHSFGGKVALAYARDHGAGLRAVWVLDAVPGRVDLEDGEVDRVVSALRAIPMPVARRNDVHAALVARGFSDAISSWMTTNLAPVPDGYGWRFDLDAIAEMLASYERTDLWPFLDQTRLDVRVVRAERSDRWTPHELAPFETAPPNVQLVPLARAGHWVHVDNPEGLLTLLAETFADRSSGPPPG